MGQRLRRTLQSSVVQLWVVRYPNGKFRWRNSKITVGPTSCYVPHWLGKILFKGAGGRDWQLDPTQWPSWKKQEARDGTEY